MDSSLAMGRLEIAVRRPARISGPVKERGAGAPGAPTPPTPTHLSGCVPLSHQVAGHKYGVDKVGILQHPDGTVLKQLQPPPRGPREMQFYSMVYAEDCSDPCLLDLQRYLPKYYGTWSSPDSPTDLYLNLEDVTRSFKKPCIMDVKIGQRSYDPYASQEKREQQIRKYPLMEEIGYLVLGMRVYNVGSDSFDTYDQHFGRALLKDTVKDGLSRFFYNGAVLRKDAVTASMAKVQKILQWFEGQSQLNFYASSLLFVYEGALPPAGHPDDADPTEIEVETTLRKPDEGPMLEYNNNIEQSLCTMYSLHKKSCINSHHQAANSGWRHDARQHHPNANGNRDCDLNLDLAHPETRLREKPVGAEPPSQSKSSAGVEVRMIDFAHVFPSEVKDHGYIYGLKNLLEALRQILED